MGISIAQFLASDLAVPNVDACWSPGTAFQILTVMLVDRVGQPGTGKHISLDVPDLVHCNLGFSKEDKIIMQASQIHCTQITPLFLLSVLYIDSLNDYNRQDGQK